MSNVKRVFNHYRKTAGCNLPLTHTSLGGGSYCVPTGEDAERKIHDALVADLRDGVPYFINEIATPIFCMFFDIDFLIPERLTDVQLEDFAKIVHQVVARFFPTELPTQIPRFFEQILLHSESPMLCDTRSSLSTLLKPQNAFQTDCVVTVAAGRIGHEGKMSDVVWTTPPASDGTYQIKANRSSDLVQVVTENAPTFLNPQVASVQLDAVRRRERPPDGSLNVIDELAGVGSVNYTAATTFAIDDDTFFVNRERRPDGMLKHGVHIIFPEVKINIEQALVMREALVERLRVEYGMTHALLAPNGWTDVVDNGVYGTGKGLRMYGANKTVKCTECRGRKDVDCPRNCNAGKVDIGRPHLLHSVYIDGNRSHEHERQYTMHLSHIIRRTSIRTVQQQPHPGWSRYVGCPGYGDALKTTVDKAGNTVHDIKKGKSSTFKSDRRLPMLKAPVDIDNAAITSIFERLIRSRFVPQYRNLRVTCVKKCDGGRYFVNVAGEGQHFCLNKQPPADHTSNTIYFQCTKAGICARCRCPKEVERAKGMCRNFCSTIRPLSRSDMETLFPEAVEASSLCVQISGKAVKKQRT